MFPVLWRRSVYLGALFHPFRARTLQLDPLAAAFGRLRTRSAPKKQEKVALSEGQPTLPPTQGGRAHHWPCGTPAPPLVGCASASAMSDGKESPIDGPMLHTETGSAESGNAMPSFIPDELRAHILADHKEAEAPKQSGTELTNLRLDILREKMASRDQLHADAGDRAPDPSLRPALKRGPSLRLRREVSDGEVPPNSVKAHASGNEAKHRIAKSEHSDLTGHGHGGHHDGGPRWKYSILAGLILGIFMYVTCNVFGILLFEVDDRLQRFDMLGVFMALASFIFGGSVLAIHSQCRILISGPDINPILFLIEIALVISETIKPEDPNSEKQLLPTVLFTITFCTLLVSISFYVIGRFRLTKFVQFLPPAVVHGFLASVGVLIVKEAIVVATGFHWKTKYLAKMWTTWKSWKQILCSIAVGVPLYLLKRHHVIHPTVLIPVMLALPLLVFYLSLVGSDTTVNEARGSGWFFLELEWTYFYEDFSQLWPNIGSIHWGAFNAAQPIIWVMQVVVIMDTLVKLSSIESNLGQNMDLNREIELAGRANLIGFLTMSVPTYGLHLFTTLNYRTIHTTDDPVPGYIAIGLCVIFFFWGFPLVNYLPRFLCAGLIMYKGLTVLVANLWDTRRQLGKVKQLCVWGIVIIAYFQGLVLAVVIGVVLSSLIFVVQYAKRFDIKSKWNLRTYHSAVVRLLLERQKLEQFGERMLGLQLNGYLFFGSEIKIATLVEEHLVERSRLPQWEHVSHVVFDFESVDGMDSARTFRKIEDICNEFGAVVVWSSLTDKLRSKLEADGVSIDYAFPTFDEAVEFVEEAVLEAAQLVRSRWFVVPAMLKLHCLASHFVFAGHLEEILSETHVQKFCKKIRLDAGATVFRMGDELDKIWLLHQGKVALTVNSRSGGKVVEQRVSVLKTGVVSQTLPGMVCSESCRCLDSSTFLTIDKHQFQQFQDKYPFDVIKIMRLLIQDIAETKSQIEHKTDHAIADDEFLQRELEHEIEQPIGQSSRHKSQLMLQTVSNLARRRARSVHAVARADRGSAEVEAREAALDAKNSFDKKQKNPFLHQPSRLLTLARQKTKTDDEKVVPMAGSGDNKGPGRHRRSRDESFDDTSGDLSRVGSRADLKSLDVQKRTHVFAYVLSKQQRFTYRKIFRELSEPRKVWGGVSKDHVLAMSHLRHALLDLGFYVTLREIKTYKRRMGIPDRQQHLTLREFLRLMRLVSMAELTPILEDTYHRLYGRFARRAEEGLALDELHAMMRECYQQAFVPEDLDTMIDLWGDKKTRRMNYRQFVSMMAYSQMQNAIEREVEGRAFSLFSRGGRVIRWRGVQAALEQITRHKISDAMAQEMLWEADVHKKGYIDHDDFLQLVVTIYKPGSVVLWNFERGEGEVVRLDQLQDSDLVKFDQEVEQYEDSKVGMGSFIPGSQEALLDILNDDSVSSGSDEPGPGLADDQIFDKAGGEKEMSVIVRVEEGKALSGV